MIYISGSVNSMIHFSDYLAHVMQIKLSLIDCQSVRIRTKSVYIKIVIIRYYFTDATLPLKFLY